MLLDVGSPPLDALRQIVGVQLNDVSESVLEFVKRSVLQIAIPRAY